MMTPELASPSPKFPTSPTGGRLRINKFSIHRPLKRRNFICFPRSGNPSLSEATAEHIEQSFHRSPTKSTSEVSRELEISQSEAHTGILQEGGPGSKVHHSRIMFQYATQHILLILSRERERDFREQKTVKNYYLNELF
ncbi:hypothetical protein TNCV_4596361 [Trichonephila clavipes]|uniref:Uncharacterized protein n=1 Tax=Trichonephila clavipes TaxID=2585209 RepID=A0A8X6WFE2_TRICX|nr:hypothetical protein TNCV_4596361 [Trichonephila clavipes]